ncbi:MAG: hypothetical protein N838_27470 [Thiohalocapsa sp. PB-PSB1]|nr:MAG: hypothetical protein N838_00565 [Thiohalocapsa sp. PB-PSB1]QQO56550.1 MAG: hypothetical protein N838_27470 [Thiohalocapsa sp. PB-PSB1]
MLTISMRMLPLPRPTRIASQHVQISDTGYLLCHSKQTSVDTGADRLG